MLRLVRMEDLANRATSQISGGQQQRVALARALAPHPEVLLLDEPLSALDLKLRKAMQIELKRLQRDTGITFVFVTHDQEEALTMSDRIAVMSQGKVRQVGSPREIYDHPGRALRRRLHRRRQHAQGRADPRSRATRGLVRLAAGIEVPARVPEGAPRSGEVTVVVRPEHAIAGRRPGRAAGCRPWSRMPSSSARTPSIICGSRAASRSSCVVRTPAPTSAPIATGAGCSVLLGEHAVQVLRD